MRGEPSGRRRFLDQLLVQLTPRLSPVIADYERVLRQRNTLLKSARGARLPETGLSTLEIWDERLVALGSEIIEARGALVARLRPHVDRGLLAIAGASQRAELANELSILGAQPDEDPAVADAAGAHRDQRGRGGGRLPQGARARRRAELDRGLTLVGPHRDDLVLALNGLPARGYASHGESWSFALALKLASAAVLRAESPAGDPVLILDDVFAELDEARRGRLAAAVGDYEQVLITAAVFDDVPDAARDPRRAHPGRADRRRRGVMNDDREPEHVAVYRRLRRVFGANSGSTTRAMRAGADARRGDETSVPYGTRPRPARARRRARRVHLDDGLGLPARAGGAARRVARDRRRRDRRALRRRSASRTAC